MALDDVAEARCDAEVPAGSVVSVEDESGGVGCGDAELVQAASTIDAPAHAAAAPSSFTVPSLRVRGYGGNLPTSGEDPDD